MRKLIQIFIISIWTLCSFSIANAQIVAWQFGNPASAGNEVTYGATTTDAHLNTVTLSRGAGVNTSALARGFSGTNFTAAGNKADAIANNKYFEFTLNATATYKVSLSTIDARMRRTSTGPNAYIWRYSTDGGSNFTDIGTDVSFTSTVDGVDQTQIDLSGISALQNVQSGTSIILRLYCWGASAVGGTFAIGRYAAAVTTNSLAIGGTVTTSASATVVVNTATFNGSFGGIVNGSSSSSSTYSVSGSNLTANIIIHPPTGFEIRTGANPFSTTDITLVQSGGTVNSTNIDVRFTPTGIGPFTGDVTNSSTGAAPQNVPVSGNGLSTQPGVQASNVTFATVTASSFTINFNAGDGTNRIVLVKSGSAVDAAPVDGTTYTANTAFGSGTQIGTGNYVVYNGTGTSVAVTNLSGGTTYHVAVYEFNGSAGSENYNTTGAPTNSQLTLASTTSVVINKYQNSTPDAVELLVIENNLDMRGMIIKDFSGSMGGDGGGKFQFTTNTVWSSVPAGTLIVLRNNATAADSVASDYSLDLGLTNTSFFTNLGGTFDIATTEVVMIKSAGSDPAGVSGCIHALAGGTAGTYFTTAPTPKLIATGTSGTNFFVYANNTNSVLGDYNGTDATGGATGLTFGSGNNASNTAYINSLRNTTYTSNGTIPAGSYGSVTINGSGIVVTLGGNVTIGTLTLIDGIVELGSNDLTVTSTVGGNASTYIRTNGTGRLKINNVGNTNVVFPIGNTTYNQLIINNSGTVDNFSVNVQTTLDNPTSHNDQAVQLQWNISEDVAGGSNAILNFRWPGSAEGPGVNHIDPSNVKIGHFTGGLYVEVPSDPVVDLGGNTYTIASSTGVTSFSPFIIANQGVAPVELSSFASTITANNVKLSWSTVTEINNSGFDIERKTVSGTEWTKISNVAGNATSNEAHSYSYEDRNLASGKYNYRLKQIDYNGNFKYYELSNEVVVGVPTKYDLSQNYPNPFNPSTTINYELPKSNFVSLKVYDMMGREVANLVNSNQEAGFYSIKFDASKLSSGIYFYKLQANDFTATKKLMLVK